MDTNGSEQGQEVLPLDVTVCDKCIEENFTRAVGIQRCSRCAGLFCVHYASKASPLEYCVNCMSNLSLFSERQTTSYEVYNPKTDTVSTIIRKNQPRIIRMTGDDWLFAQRRIYELSDEELELSTEFHKGYLNLLGEEQLRRRVEKAHKECAKSLRLHQAAGAGVASTVVKTETKVVKTKVVSTEKKKEQAAALMGTLSPAELAQLMLLMSKK